MEFIPIFLAARDRHVVIVGGGQMADAKCRGVIKTSACVTVFADNPSEQALAWSQSGDITLRAGLPESTDLTGVAVVYAAHHSDQVNDQIAVLAREKGALVNVLDRTYACDFITPAIVDRNPVVVAIGTEGSAPVLARQIKADIEAMLPADLGRFARLANAFRTRVDEAFQRLRAVFNGQDLAVLGDIQKNFAPPHYVEKSQESYFDALDSDSGFRKWVERNVSPHKHPSYASVTISLKGHGDTPGDATSDQMRAIADLAEKFGHDELRISHKQNIVLPHVAQADLPAIYRTLKPIGLATANIGLISDIIACPGMDYCALATARSIPIAQDISLRYARREAEIGHMQIKISGCINACGHHHVGHVGILGLDKAGVENYQITLGGSAGNDAAIGEKMGRGFNVDELMPALDRLIDAYLALRLNDGETFSETVKRLGTVPFQEVLYVVDQAA